MSGIRGVRGVRAIVIACALALPACTSAKREASMLVSAVDAFRRAENGAKAAKAKAIEDAACTEREVCEAREACLASSRPTATGLTLKAEVEAAVADLHSGKLTQEEASSRDLPKKLDEASRMLLEGHAKLPACDAKLTALRLRYGL